MQIDTTHFNKMQACGAARPAGGAWAGLGPAPLRRAGRLRRFVFIYFFFGVDIWSSSYIFAFFCQYSFVYIVVYIVLIFTELLANA